MHPGRRGRRHPLVLRKPEFAEFAPGMKTIEDARYVRDGILAKFEMAELTTDPQ